MVGQLVVGEDAAGVMSERIVVTPSLVDAPCSRSQAVVASVSYWLGVQGLDQGASLVRRSGHRAIVGTGSDTT